MWKIKRYRGKYYAVKRVDGQPVRRSLRTADYNTALRVFETFKKSFEKRETVKDMFEAYKETRSENEQRILGFAWRHLEPSFGYMTPDQVDRSNTRLYAEERLKSVKENTVIRELGALKAAINYHDRTLIKSFYMPTKPDPKDRYLSKEEFEALYDGAESPHIKLFILLALSTAARTSAILELKWDNIDFKRGMIDLGRGNIPHWKGILIMTQATSYSTVIKKRSTGKIRAVNSVCCVTVPNLFKNIRRKIC